MMKSIIKEYSPEWIKPKRYDFYFELDNKKYIIEAHGEQHYINGFGKNSKEVQENDEYKKEIAIKNKIKEENYIVLDCRKSNLEWVKNSIINSKINYIFDLNNINWLECEEFTSKNIVKEVCDYWKIHNNKNNENITVADLDKVFKLDRTTIRNYLKKGTKLKWCNYNPRKEFIKSKGAKKVEVFKNKQSLGIFESYRELERQSEELFGTKLYATVISKVIRGQQKEHKGFTFKLVENEE